MRSSEAKMDLRCNLRLEEKQKMKIKRTITLTELERRKSAKKNYFIAALTAALLLAFAPFALAEGTDPLAAINNLSDFVFSAIKAIGIILLGWGVVQIGMSLQSHDPSQRSSGFLTFFGGLMIAFAKEILELILK